MCPISFVKDVLVRSTRSYLPSVAVPHLTSPPLQFPYALRTLPAILSTKWSDPSFLPTETPSPNRLGDHPPPSRLTSGTSPTETSKSPT